jgi:predicted phage-related endonuclease
MKPIERVEITADYDWLEARRQYIGASEVATVCGVAAYGSLAELFCEKKGLRPPRLDSAVMRRGRWGEAAVFQALTDMRPDWQVQRAAIHLIDRENRIAATPDGFAYRPDRDGIGLLEAKTVARSVYRQKWLGAEDGEDGEAVVPPHYLLQTLTTMMLAECKWASVVVLSVGEYGWDFNLIDVERDSAIEERIKYDVAHFYEEYFDKNVMPNFEPQRDEVLVKQLFPQDDGTEIDLTTDNRAATATEELVEVQAAIKRLEKNEGALKTELTAKLGAATYGRLADGRRLSWRLQHRKGYAVEPADFRVFRILKQQGENL